MQRASFVLTTVLMLLSLTFSATAIGFEFEGKVYSFRDKNDEMELPSSRAEETQPEKIRSMSSEEQTLKQLEQEGYVFKPLRKRKTLEDPPVTQNFNNPGSPFPNCPAPKNPATQPQASPTYNPAAAYPVAPGYPGLTGVPTPYPGVPGIPGAGVTPPYPAVPGAGVTPPLGYPYTYPSQQNFPYPSGGQWPFPGGLGIPRW